jgi:hypothetical protein
MEIVNIQYIYIFKLLSIDWSEYGEFKKMFQQK